LLVEASIEVAEAVFELRDAVFAFNWAAASLGVLDEEVGVARVSLVVLWAARRDLIVQDHSVLAELTVVRAIALLGHNWAALALGGFSWVDGVNDSDEVVRAPIGGANTVVLCPRAGCGELSSVKHLNIAGHNVV